MPHEQLLRLFVALEIPDVQKKLLARIQSRLKPVYQVGTYAEPENAHITMHFLGDTAVSKLPGVIELFNKIPMPMLELAIGDVIALPDATKARASAVILKGDVVLLADLHDRMGQALKPAGFRLDHRKFLPHITLARFKFPLAADRLEEGQKVISSLIENAPSFRIGQFTLYQSTFESKDDRYAALGRFPKNNVLTGK